MLTSQDIEELEDLPLSQNDYLWHFAKAVEKKVLAKLRKGGVELPEPVELNPAANSVIGYTQAQLLNYGDRRAADVVEDFKADLADALCEDCENGVKWLNEQAIEKFKRDFPNVYKVMQSTIPKEPT